MSEFDTLFYKNPYLTEFETTVVDCIEAKNGFMVSLEETAFYPEGGGQPADNGYLNDVKVFDVRKKDGIIYHYVAERLEAGSKVKGRIDWPRRFDHMQQHSGEHIFSGIVHKLFGYDNIGFHMGEDVITLDFSGALDWNDVLKVEEQSNALIYRNVETIELFPNALELEQMDFRSKKELKGEVRIIEIPDGDVCACCGTHVRRSGEVGLIKALSVANKGEGSRVVIVCGKRAYDYVREIYNQVKGISTSLASKPLEIEKAVNHLKDVNASLKSKVYTMQKAYFENKLASYPDSDELIAVYEKEADANEFRKFVDDLASKGKGKIICGFNENENGFNYVIVSYSVGLRALGKSFNSKVNGRGGGSEQMLQGSLKASKEEIEKAISEVFG